MSSSALPFDDIRNLLIGLPGGSGHAEAAARERNAQLVKPIGSLGRLEEIAFWLARWQGREKPRIDRPFTVIFAANHGVHAQDVSPSPQALTRQMLETFAAGGGAVNQIAGTFGVGLKVFELALDYPTKDMSQEPALDEQAAAATFAFGMEAIAGEPDLLCLGETGAGNTTVAAAIYAALFGGDARLWTGRSAAMDDAAFERKVETVKRALAVHEGHLSDPLEIMRRVGGREICALAGAIVAARLQGVPVVLDGYTVCAAAALLQAMNPEALDHCIAGHVTPQAAHADVLRRLGKAPLLDMGINLGEATGAALAAGIIKAAAATHNDMATREQAGVTGLP
ncbi:MAG: nicotinate-nucleotide--dimethylbenzimidazole phosphoribosyltransferase [Hyphomicrobiales bacterium]|nr:nicotinate-nucleotide--dimethylbenzimidazole phosphoribosyltransferase [Hyphomicrobiales bacterium]